MTHPDAASEALQTYRQWVERKHDPAMVAEGAQFHFPVHERPLDARGLVWHYEVLYGSAVTNPGFRTRLFTATSEGAIIMEGVYHGEHTGDFFGIPASGAYFELPLMLVYEVRDGLIRGGRCYYDLGSLHRQLHFDGSIRRSPGVD